MTAPFTLIVGCEVALRAVVLNTLTRSLMLSTFGVLIGVGFVVECEVTLSTMIEPRVRGRRGPDRPTRRRGRRRLRRMSSAIRFGPEGAQGVFASRRIVPF